MSNSGSTYSMPGTGNRYDPRARSQVNPTQAPEQRSRSKGSQTGTDDHFDPEKPPTPKEMVEQREFDMVLGDGRIQKVAGGDYQHTPASALNPGIGPPSTGSNKDEEASRSNTEAVAKDVENNWTSSITRCYNRITSLFNTSGDSPQGDTCAEPTNTEESGGRANSEDPGSSNREVAIQESDSSGSTEASKSIKARLEDVYHGVAEYVNPTPKTKINIKAGKGSYIVASQSTIDNADIRTESKSGENHIIAFSGPGQCTHTRAPGRIEKKAGGEFKNFPNAVKGNENSDTKQLPGGETGEAKP